MAKKNGAAKQVPRGTGKCELIDTGRDNRYVR
jgi:hypothetical protein